MYVIEPDPKVIDQVVEQIKSHQKNMTTISLTRWDWEEINRRGWEVELEGRKVLVVLESAELHYALNYWTRESDASL